MSSYIAEFGLGFCYLIITNIPDQTATHLIVDTSEFYFSVDFGSYYSNDIQDWCDSDYRTESELIESYATVINLEKLKKELLGYGYE